MPSEVRVVDQKFYYQLRNGDTFTENTGDFTRHLKGNILEKVKAVFNIQLNWYIKFQGNKVVGYYHDTSANTLTVSANGSDLIANGFAIGDTFKYSDINWKFEGTITALTPTEFRADVSSLTGTPVADAWSYPTEETFLTGTTKKTALEYKFGLIEQNESFNTLSKLTNTNQIYRVSGIDHDAPLTFSDGQIFGNNKAWVTGSMKCAFVGLSFDKDEINTGNTTQEFQIEHEFTINPFYRDGDLDSLKGEDVPPLDIFNGEKSLKYVFESEFRTEISNPNTSMVTQYDTQLGSVGYFNENYNGFPNNYSSDSLVYTVGGETVDKIESSAVTSVSFNINDSLGNFSGNTYLIIGHASIIDSDQYSNSSKEYDELWNNENIRTRVLLPPLSKNYIKNFVATVSSANLITVSFDIDLTTAETVDGQNYILYYGIEEEDLTPDLSGKITGLVDVNQYYKNSDIDGLWSLNKFEQYPHPDNFVDGVSVGFTNVKGFNEEGYLLDAEFTKDAEATLESLSFEVVVYNTVTKEISTLRSLEVDLSSQIVTGTSNLIIQNLAIDSTRGYILKDTDQFNFLKLENNAFDYSFQLGYKIPWQEWAKWKQAPTDFYDRNKPQDGLNQKSSNYSDTVANYELRVLTRAELLKDGIVTEYVDTSEKLTIFDYDTDDQTPDAYSGEISTYNFEGQKLEGNIIEKDFTELRARIIPENPPTFTESVDFTEVTSQWNRFAHGNVFADNRVGVFGGANRLTRENSDQIVADPTSVTGKTSDEIKALLNIPFGWENDQANNIVDVNDPLTDLFGASPPERTNKFAASLYTSTPNSITCNNNLNAFYGCFSLLKYEFYDIKGNMYSTDVDNDVISYVLAFNTDDEGVEHTLSLVATTGGLLLDTRQDLKDNPDDITINSFQGLDEEPQWALVYNYGKVNAEQIFLEVTSAPTGLGWNAVNDLIFDIQRKGNEFVIKVDWEIQSVNYSQTWNYDIFSNSYTEKFARPQSIGFAFNSQDKGGFRNVVLTYASGDYYGILRAEPKNSGSDFSISELSSLREGAENSLLTQITGAERKASLEWDGEAFVLQGLIDTSNMAEGEEYDFSYVLRLLNLDDSVTL